MYIRNSFVKKPRTKTLNSPPPAINSCPHMQHGDQLGCKHCVRDLPADEHQPSPGRRHGTGRAGHRAARTGPAGQGALAARGAACGLRREAAQPPWGPPPPPPSPPPGRRGGGSGGGRDRPPLLPETASLPCARRARAAGTAPGPAPRPWRPGRRLPMTCTRQMAQVSHSTSQLHMATAFHFFSENILSGAPALEPAEPGSEWGAPGSSPSSTSAMAEGRGRGGRAGGSATLRRRPRSSARGAGSAEPGGGERPYGRGGLPATEQAFTEI